jgi:TonB family protein
MALVTTMAAGISCLAASQPVKTPGNVQKWVIQAPQPDYPLEARQRHATGGGIFVLRVQIKSGRVKGVEVARSTGHAILDAAAVKALRQWRFKADAPLRLIKDILPDQKDPFATQDSLIKVPVRFVM